MTSVLKSAVLQISLFVLVSVNSCILFSCAYLYHNMLAAAALAAFVTVFALILDTLLHGLYSVMEDKVSWLAL